MAFSVPTGVVNKKGRHSKLSIIPAEIFIPLQQIVLSISKLDFRKRREERGDSRPTYLRNAVAIRCKDVGEAATASEPGGPGGQDDVLAQQRAINEPDSQIVADLVTDVVLG